MSLLKIKSMSILALCSLLITPSISYAISEFENGENHIVGTRYDKIELDNSSNYVFSSYEKSATFYLYNKKTINLYSSASTKSKIIASISPQLLSSLKRKGDYFLIDSYAGPAWIYADDNVELREIDDMSNDYFTTSYDLKLYSQPFVFYPTNKSLPAGTYLISKKSGDWFYINNESYNGWFTTTKGYFNNTTNILNESVIDNIPIRIKFPDYSDNVRPGNPMKPKYITIHNTGNTSKGANALAHANLLANNNNGRTASWHYTVDDNNIYQSIPLNEIAYHAGDGDGPGNRSSIGIEICENSDGNYAQAEKNAAKLTAKLLLELNLPLTSVKKHQDFSGKNCPARIINRVNGWNEFMSSVEKYYNSINKIYYLDINSFLGDNSVDSAIKKLKNDTGWYLEKQPTGDKLSVYELETGGFIDENNVKSAVNTIKSITNLDVTYSPTGSYVDIGSLPIFLIETGGFYGEDNVKFALNRIKSETGWYGAYKPSETLDNVYHITLYDFYGEDTAIDAVNKLKNDYGWWSHYYPTGNFINSIKKPIYSIKISNILSSHEAQSLVDKLQSNYGWWSHYYNMDSINYYRIVTGGFLGLNMASEKAQYIRDNYGWYTEVKRQ